MLSYLEDVLMSLGNLLQVDFGHVQIPRDLVKPAPQVSPGLQNTKPLIKSSSVTILDTDTIKVDDFSLDDTVQGQFGASPRGPLFSSRV